MRNSKTLNMSMNVFWGLFAAACFSCGAHAQSLSLAGHDYVSTRVTSGNVWALLDLRNASGKPVTGLDLAQVTVRESLVDVDTGAAITAPREVDVAAQAATAWMEAGLWEKTVGDLKLDIVFMADGTASNGTAVASLRSDMHAFTDTLLAHHVDFRMAVASFGEVPVGLDPSPFYGPTEIEKLRAEIDAFPQMGGDGWSPTVAYDAVMNSVWSGFREDAHQVVVVVTDIAPQTVYGTFWYPNGCTAATLSGMELFLKEHDFHLFFSHDADTSGDPDYQFYCDPDINPRAGINESGFEALAKKNDALGRPLAVNLGWPFQLNSLKGAMRERLERPSLFLTPLPITESVYLVSWMSDFYWHDDIETLPGEPNEVLYRADISFTIPGTKTAVSTFCTYPTQKAVAPMTINVMDEHGDPQDDAWAYVEALMGDRKVYYWGQLGPMNGQIAILNAPVGRYLLTVQDASQYPQAYENLRAMNRMEIDIPPEGATIDLVMTSIDKHADLARTRGLLQDLADWRSPGDPFQDFADDANAWLDALEADGISWLELVRIKRFEMALSGYAAITEYAHLQTEGAIEDFYQILMDFIAIIQETKELHDSVDSEWQQAAIEILSSIVDVLITHGQFTANRELLETALNELLEYAETDLITALKEQVVAQIPAGPYKPLITAMMYTCLDADFDDWTPVMEAAQELALNLAKKEVIDLLAENIVETLFEGIAQDNPMEEAVGGLVRNLLDALVSEDGFENFDAALEAFANEVGHYVLQEGTNRRPDVVAAVESLFGKIEAQLPAGTFRDFLLGMTKELALQAIPAVEGGALKYEIDSDAVVKILVRHALYNVVLKDYYAEEVKAGLYETLYRAQAYVPEGSRRADYQSDMYSDFNAFRWPFYYGDSGESINDDAWEALSVQPDINDWANALTALGCLLDALSVPLEFFAGFYPPLQDTADAVSDFVDVLDGLQIVARSIEFGLRLDCLDSLADFAEPFYETIFPTPAEDVYLMGVTPVEHDFGQTRATRGAMLCPVTIWNAGNTTLNIATMTLSDTTNFSFAELTKSLSPVIEPGHSHTVYVKFDPTCTGEFETALTVYCGVTDPPRKAITLRGVGTYLDRGVTGDANSDTRLNAVDVQLVINAALGIFNYAHTDLNNDGKDNAVDVQLIINAVLGLPVSF